MWLPLLLCVVAAAHPIIGSETMTPDQTSGAFNPSSVDDCLSHATTQLPRWKQVYELCLLKFLTQDRSDDAGSAMNVVDTDKDAQYQDLPNMDSDVFSSYVMKQSSDETKASSKVNDENGPQSDLSSSSSGEADSWKKRSSKGSGWLPVYRRSIYRTRRQHALSINSALISLADMLMAEDYNREQARQRAFREQLLGLGR